MPDCVHLANITAENWEAVCMLRPGADGAAFVADNAFSIAQSVFEKGWTIRAILVGDELAGFAMHGFCDETGGYELCRFMLDERFQGKGYGQIALNIVLAEMHRMYKNDTLYISTDPKNCRARHVYEKAGFVATGKFCGTGDDREDIFVLERKTEGLI